MYGVDLTDSEDEFDDFSFDSSSQAKENRHIIISRELTAEEKHENRLKAVFGNIISNKTDAVIEELNNGLDLNEDLNNGWTALMLAATVPNDELIKFLIDKGVDVNQRREGTTALMHLCNTSTNCDSDREKILKAIKLLIDSGADASLIDRRRRNALMFAASNGHLEAVKILLAVTDRKQLDNQNVNALFWACDGNHPEVVKYLLDEGFSPDDVDVRSYTPRMIAENNNHMECLKLFPELPTNNFMLHLSFTENFEEMFQQLDQSGLPVMFSEVCKILYGTKSDTVSNLILDTNLSLIQLLSIDEPELIFLGIELPFQRKRILEGLYKFHKRPFLRKSVPYVPKTSVFSTLDVSVSILSCLRQTIAMTASLRYIKRSIDNLPEEKRKDLRKLTIACTSHVSRLRNITEIFLTKTKNWDLSLVSPDKITKKRLNIPWGYVYLSVSLASAASVALLVSRLK